MRYFDAHTHIQFDPYAEDREEVLVQMQKEEVGGLIVGVDLESSRQALALALAERHENLWAAVGLHPNHEDDEWFEEKNYLELLAHPRVVAVGECGLDYFRPTHLDDEVKRKQKNVFQDHIELAVKSGKPLMIHARPAKGTMDAYEDALSLLEDAKRTHPELSGNFHFFVGDRTIAERIFALGFTISYTAVLTFTHDYDEVVRSAPLDRLLAETDAPYVAPASRRGQRNDSLAVKDVVAALARIRGEDEESVRAAVLENAARLFRL